MATDVEKLVVQIAADLSQYKKGMEQAAGVTSRQARAIEARWRQANKNLDGIGRDMARSLIAPLAGVVGALGTREILSYADAWTRAGNLIAAAGQVAGRQGRSLEGINQIAQDTRGEFGATAELYARLLRSTANVAESEREVAQATETVNKAFKAGGAASSEMAAGVLQLSQGLGSGVLAGDELRSVRENAPLLAQAIADYFGTTIAGLKKLGEEGRLTSDKVFKAILSAKGKIDGAFNATSQTIGDAVTRINNAFTQYIGQSDEGLGATGRLTAGLNALANNFDNVADTTLKVASIIAAALVGRSIGGMIAKLGIATSAVTTFVAALRTASIATAIGGLGAAAGPIGLLIGGTVATALALYYSNSKDATAGSKEYAKALKQVEDAAKRAGPAVEGAAASAAKAADEAFAAAQKKVADDFAAALEPASRDVQTFIDLWRGSDDVGVALLERIQSLISEVAKGKAPVSSLKTAIEELGKLDAFSKIAGDLSALLGGIDKASGKFKSLSDQIEKNRAAQNPPPVDPSVRQAKIDKAAADYLADAERRNKLTKDQLALEEEIARVKKDALGKGVELTDAQAKRAAQVNISGNDRRSAEGRVVRKTADSRFDQDIQSVRDRTAALVEEQRIIGLSVAEQESRRMALDLEQQALKNLREEARRKGETDLESIRLSDEQRQKIDDASEAYGRQAKALERVREKQQRAEQMASEFYESFKSGMADAITGAKSFDEALQGVLKRLGDLLINSAFDSLFKPAGGGGLFKSLVDMFKFDDGGYTGPGGKHQPAGVVHKGEVVWSQKDVRNAGGVGVVEAMRRGARGYADGGVVAAPRFSASTLPSISKASSAISVSMRSGDIVIQGSADQQTLAIMRQELARRDAEFPSRVVRAVQKARSGRVEF